MTHPYLAGTEHPRVLAHRGLPSVDGSVIENTAAAFAAAHAAGAEYIETDCRVTADGDVVLFHDATLERVLQDPRPIADVRTRELADLLAPLGGLLTVSEALTGFPGIRFNIDVKTDAAAEAAGQAIAAHAERVLLTSFSDARRRRALDAAQRAGAERAPATSGGRSSIAALVAASRLRLPLPRRLRELDAVQIPERQGAVRIFTPALVRAAHRHGIEVHVWTVNDPVRMRELVDAGADGIVTDRADVAITALRAS